MLSMSTNKIPLRKDVPEKDKWDLSTLYKSDESWEDDFKTLPEYTEKLLKLKGKLAESSNNLLAALKILADFYEKIEMLDNYASLKHAADGGDSKAQNMEGRASMAYADFNAKTSFLDPELMAISNEKINEWIERPEFKDYKIYVQKSLHFKPHTLSEAEEKIISLQSEGARTASNTFSLLTNVDMQFGTVKVDGEEQPLTQSTYSVFLQNPDREIRKDAYKKFYKEFEKHQNTIGALYGGSVNQDVFLARARKYDSTLEMRLYPDNVPKSVYMNLIETVHKNLPVLHRFYALRKRILGLSELRHYDVYVPLVKNVESKTTYEEGVEICRNALAVLGEEYTDMLCDGLLNGWVDRYENKGKRSGAFSSGVFKGYPYIMLNYKDDNIRDVFTMAHEGGHSMHSWYSKNNNPILQYNYTIFEAEVASTFNEELVFEYLLKNAKTAEMRNYLLAMRANDILATLHRQTMFAEFELKAHELVENGTPLSADLLRKIYRGLLELYFGPDMVFEEESDLEGLRIPHFYGAYYVYKYATGISASLALAKRVTQGGAKEKEDYFNFLKSGGSRYPIESLKLAGVDMSSPEPVQSALDSFEDLVNQLEKTL